MKAVDVQPTACAPADRRFWLFLAGFYVAWIVRVLLLPVDARFESEIAKQCWSQGWRLAVWMAPVWLYLRRIDRADPIEALALRTPPKRVWRGLAIAVAFLAITGLCAFLFQGGSWRGLGAMTPAQWASFAITMSCVAFAEEVLFRGFVYPKLRAAHAPWRAILLSSALFMLAHWPGWLYMQGLHASLITLSVGVLVAGAAFALIVEVTGSLYAAIALHFLNNLLARLVLP